MESRQVVIEYSLGESGWWAYCPHCEINKKALQARPDWESKYTGIINIIREWREPGHTVQCCTCKTSFQALKKEHIAKEESLLYSVRYVKLAPQIFTEPLTKDEVRKNSNLPPLSNLEYWEMKKADWKKKYEKHLPY